MTLLPRIRRPRRDFRPEASACEPRTLLTLGWTFDITGAYPPLTPPGGGTTVAVSADAVLRNLEEAGRLIASALPEWKGTVDVDFAIVAGGGNATGRGGGQPVGQQYLGPVRRDGRTLQVYEPDIIHEARTGVDPSPGVPDVRLTFDATFLRDRVWIDTSPGLTGSVPGEKVDFVSLAVHELIHGLGFYAYRSNGLGTTVGFGAFADDSRYSFDLLTSDPVSLPAGRVLSFVGSRAQAAYGGKPVPLTSVSPLTPGVTTDLLRSAFTHVGNPRTSGLPGQDLLGDPMNGVQTPVGRRYTASDLALDAAILDDLLHVTDRTDLMFVIDATGSMADDIAAVRSSAGAITDRLLGEQPFSRIGVAAYRDQGDAFVARAVLSLTDDPAEVHKALGSIDVSGGGDFPEAVYSGLLLAINQGGGLSGWRTDGTPKAIVAMGDAPPHDPEKVTGYTLADVNEAARRGGVTLRSSSVVSSALADRPSSSAETAPGARPVDIHTIAIGGEPTTVASFEKIAAANRGRAFRAAGAGDLGKTVLAAIDVTMDAAINHAPTIESVPDVTVGEGETASLTVRGADRDPGQLLTYSLDSAPAGAAIDPTTGVFTWTPSETDGPGEYSVTVRAVDDGATSFGALATFTIRVLEVNQAPVLDALPDVVMDEGGTLRVVARASDRDSPSNRLWYGLVAGPSGATIDAETGILTWTAGSSGPARFTIRTTDDGSPPLSAERSFVVQVRNVPPTVALSGDATALARGTWRGALTATDPGRDLTSLVIDYGDGSAPVPLTPGEAPVHAFSAPGRYTVRATATDAEGAMSEATRDVTVLGGGLRRLTIGDGTPERSRIVSIGVEFDRFVRLAPGAIAVRGAGGRSVPVSVGQRVVDGRTALSLRFGGRRLIRGALPDGRYTFIIDGSRVTDPTGQPMDLDGDGRPGGDIVLRFRVRRGDWNGDGRVDRHDRPPGCSLPRRR